MTYAPLSDTDPPVFRLSCFHFQLRLTEATEFPIYKGSSFHGAFGHALARVGAHFRDYFYNPTPPLHWADAQQAPPRPYVLIPPLDDKTHYAAGDTLDLGVILYGAAIDYFLIVFAALEHLGELMGLGKRRGHFIIDCVQQLNAQGYSTIYQNRQWSGPTRAMQADHFFTDTPQTQARIRLNHSTRLRLKADNRLLQTAPPFNLLINRLFARINALSTLYCDGIAIVPEHKQHLLNLAETVQIERSTLHWSDWQRHSQRSHTDMPFGGLLGETIYQGELTPFIPWLSLGQWVGLGGKTSFGLGLYQLELLQ